MRRTSAADLTRLLRPDLLAMEGYEPIEPTDVLAEALGIPPERVVKLDGNENPYGPSPRALAALADARSYHIYPDPQQRKVRRALAAYLGVDEELVVAGTGSDELIDLVLRATLSPGEGVINCPPTFGMYSFSTSVCGGRVVEVPRREDFSLDLPGIEEAAGRGAKVIFVASPNNPTGNAASLREVEALLGLGLLVVVDEAYVEFGGESLVSRVPEAERLVVLRTFSKWAGLAGLRAGYGVFPPALASLLLRIKPPYNLNVAAQVAVLASLEDVGVLRERVASLVAERERLYRRAGARALPAAVSLAGQLPALPGRGAGGALGPRPPGGAGHLRAPLRYAPAEGLPAHQRRPAGAHGRAPAGPEGAGFRRPGLKPDARRREPDRLACPQGWTS